MAARKQPARGQAVRKHQAPTAVRPWPWFGAGTVVGALAVVALQFGGLLNVAPPTGDANRPQVGTEQDTAGKPPQTEFEFWTRLPKSEVVVPDVPEYASSSKTSTGEPGSTYILQAGSFRKLADADRMRAELILLGLDVQIEKVQMAEGDIWHRVQTGPYQTRREVSAARNRLANAGIEVMVLKRR